MKRLLLLFESIVSFDSFESLGVSSFGDKEGDNEDEEDEEASTDGNFSFRT